MAFPPASKSFSNIFQSAQLPTLHPGSILLQMNRPRQQIALSLRMAPSQRALSSSSTVTVPLVIHGKDIITPSTFPVICPLNREPIWTASRATRQQARDAVQSAQSAFPSWSGTKAAHRRDMLLAVADLMEKRRDELVGYMREEIGADRAYQDFILDLAVAECKETAGSLARSVQGFVPEAAVAGMGVVVEKRPYGVVVGIAPWNGLYNLGLRSVLYALAAGNTTVTKGSELSPRCHWAIADVFRQAGLPDGCVNLVLHATEDGPAVTEALVSHPNVKKINFTGSTRVGRIIAEMAGRHLKPVLLELGGKSGAIVMADADLDLAAEQCVKGAFMNAGQICMSTERILVDESIAPQFKEKLVAATRKLFESVETTSTLVSSAALDKNQQLLATPAGQGARELPIFDTTMPNPPPGNQMRPVLLDGVARDMAIFHTESFGPSVSLTTFASEAEAVDLINDSEYGLSAAVFTEDLRAGFRVAGQIGSGAVHINSMTVHTDSAMPHGGVKNSGFGRFNGQQGIDEFMYTKTVTWME